MREKLLYHPLLVSHLLLPFTAFLLAAAWLEFSGLDLWLADVIFHWSGDAWQYRDAWVTAVLIHEGGRDLVGIGVLVLLAMLVLSFWQQAWQPYRQVLVYLVVSALLSGLLINVLKSLTHIDCPWDLLRYGGTHPYVRNFQSLPAGVDSGACFPAGHASAAYSWFGLYYVARALFPRWRLVAMWGVLVLGLLFGFGQELRGAHFISHDLWTLGLCWLLATVFAFFLLPVQPARIDSQS
jgi:membrane-associated PAP2 superfamily phosphatase